MRKSIPAEQVFAKSWANKKFREAYDALEEEFALIDTLVAARMRAGLTQAELAERMGTSQAAVARMEGGRSRPSSRSLERYAAATGHRLQVRLVPLNETDDEALAAE